MADGEDRTEQASARRLERARGEGNVPLSRELSALVVLGATAMILAMAAPGLAASLGRRMMLFISDAHRLDPAAGLRMAAVAVVACAAPFVLASLLSGSAAVLLQTGFLLNLSALMPDLARLSPKRGLSRIASINALLDAGKSVAKIGIVAWAGWRALSAMLPELPRSMLWTPATLAGHALHEILQVMFFMLAAQAVITTLDMLWTRFKHARDLRMTRHDLRDEQRESDGDPQVKGRLKRLRAQRSRTRMMAAVPKATVVLTNPTHYAVALAYDRTAGGAPRVVAKGVDEVAARIRALATLSRVPVIANPPLARALYQVDLDNEIPAEHYRTVAEIIAICVAFAHSRRPNGPVTILGRLRHLVRQLAAWSRPPKLIDRLAGPGSEKPKAAIDGILHLLFDDAPFGLLVIDRHGRIVRANMAIPSMVGGPVDLSRGAPASLIFAEDVRDAAWAEIAPALAGRQHAPRSFATRLHREQVETAAGDATARVSLAVLREADGTVSGALLRISDLTHQRQLEAQLAQSQKLQAVGQLAGGIAHDFNNLLTAVLGAADSLAARDDLDAEARDDAVQISASALRGAALVRQLLAFGRQQTLQPRVVALNDAITDLSGLLRRLLGSPLRLELELEQPGHAARVDPTQFDQVLVNLAVNARDAMQDGGVLTLRTTHTTLYRALDRGPERIPPGRYVVIEVRDTGAGIPAHVLPRIFDPFFTTRRGTGGHGLGLSTVHGIVHQSDGFLDVDSQTGVGTRVRVYLPRWDGDAATAIPRIPDAAPRDPSPPAGPCRPRIVLLVDDEEPVRRLAQRMLAKAGWQVLAADSAEAALALLRAPESIRPSVIVTDMVMPGMDGGALVRAVRDHLDAPDLPAILVSGYAEETLRYNTAEAATIFVPKPYSLKDLAAQLEALLPARRSVVPSATVR